MSEIVDTSTTTITDQIDLQSALDFAAKRRSSAVIVMRDDRIIAERYLLGWDAQAPVPLTSASKSFVTVLVGILLKQGAIRHLDQSAADFLTEWRDDERVGITVRMLLNMTSGLHNPPLWRLALKSSRGLGLKLALSHPPGSEWAYNTAAYHLLFLLMERATQLPLPELCQRELFEPLGMLQARWLTRRPDSGDDEVINIAATALELAHFGQLVLQRGEWQGRALVQPEFIDEALRPTEQSNLSYGFLFWLNRSSLKLFPDAPADAVAAMGAQHCRLFVIPSQRLVIVRSGDRAALPGEVIGKRSGNRNTFDNIFLKHILEAFAAADVRSDGVALLSTRHGYDHSLNT